MSSTQLYSPLQHQADIRLLRLERGTDRESINVTLHPFSLDSSIRYHALSYVWGSLTPKRWISCNGHRIYITPSLHDVLSRLLQQGFDGLLWVDALCINQKDDEEKSIQVAMMRDIYKQAAKVIFWLGEQESFDELLLQEPSRA
jgi:hypothetical protein